MDWQCARIEEAGLISSRTNLPGGKTKRKLSQIYFNNNMIMAYLMFLIFLWCLVHLTKRILDFLNSKIAWAAMKHLRKTMKISPGGEQHYLQHYLRHTKSRTSNATSIPSVSGLLSKCFKKTIQYESVLFSRVGVGVRVALMCSFVQFALLWRPFWS